MRPRILKAERTITDSFEPIVKMVIEIPLETMQDASTQLGESRAVHEAALSIGHSILEQLRNMK